MRILLLTHAFNSLTQRLYVELTDAGHTVSIEFDVNDRVTEEAATLFRPEVIIAPFLKRAIPESVWRRAPMHRHPSRHSAAIAVLLRSIGRSCAASGSGA